MTRKKVVLFTNRAEAEAQTGYFHVSQLMVSKRLEDILGRYIAENNLETWVAQTQTKTGWHRHTLNFRFTTYEDADKRAYLSNYGALGSYKQFTVKPEPNAGSFTRGHREKQHQKYLSLKERTPAFDQMYFWIAAKYPGEILWMDYSFQPVGLDALDGGDFL